MTEITCNDPKLPYAVTVAAVANARACPSPLSENDSAPPYTYYIYSGRALSAHTQQTAYCIHIAKRKCLASKQTCLQANKTKS